MAYTRRKKVTLDGAEFMIAPLTVDQVEFQMGASLDDLQKEAQSAVMNAYVLVCTGLNNATSPEDLAAEGPWVPTRPAVDPPIVRVLTSLLDQITIGYLQEEILAFSGLKVINAPGESNATAPALD